MMPMLNPPHPGRLVRNELDELAIPVATAARGLGVTRQHLYNVVNGKTAVTPEMAIRLAKGLGGTAETWLRMQQAWDLARISIEKIEVSRLGGR